MNIKMNTVGLGYKVKDAEKLIDVFSSISDKKDNPMELLEEVKKIADYPLAVIGAVVVVYLPVTLWMRSAQVAALSPAFKEPLHYRLDDEGLTISQGENEETIKWDNCVKAVSTTRSVLVFTSRTTATIFPRKQLGDKIPPVIQCISRNMSPDKVNIKC